MMGFIDRIRKGSIFVESRNLPARFNPARIRMRVREFSTQLGLPPRGTGLRTGRAGARRGGMPRTDTERQQRHFGRIFKPLFQPSPQRRVFGQSAGQPLPPKWMNKGFKA